MFEISKLVLLLRSKTAVSFCYMYLSIFGLTGFFFMLDFIRKLPLLVVEAALSIIPIQGLEGQVIFKASAAAEKQFKPYNGVIQ